ncbi:MmcQ/YjbR family DNA-binding protein [Bacteroidota bacterium]
MNIEAYREYCLSKPAVSEEFPFDETTLVFKVAGKMFALTDVDSFKSINLKCDPDLALRLREEYPAVKPGFHMNKKHWNSVDMDQTVPDQTIFDWINHSYDLVYSGLPAKIREEIGNSGTH